MARSLHEPLLFEPPGRPLSREGGWSDDSYASAASNAIPITMVNLAKAYTYAQLVCSGTGLEADLVSAMAEAPGLASEPSPTRLQFF